MANLSSPLAQKAVVEFGNLWLELGDGQEFVCPITRISKLASAQQAELNKLDIIANGSRIRWPLIEEELSIDEILASDSMSACVPIDTLLKMTLGKIHNTKARRDALTVLPEISLHRNILLLQLRAQAPPSVGHMQLGKELDTLAANMNAVAAGLNNLSSTAIAWIGEIPRMGLLDPAFALKLEMWKKCNASDAFRTPEYELRFGSLPWPTGSMPEQSNMAFRLRMMGDILQMLATEARERHAEGARYVHAPPSADFGIFEICAGALRGRVASLAHLREIASAVYEWGIGSPPAEEWAQRQERAARSKYSKAQQRDPKGDSVHTPKK